MDFARLDGPHNGVGPDIGPPPRAEHPGSIIRECGVDFRHDAVAALEQEEPDLVAVQVFVQRRYPVDKGGQLAEQLHPDQSAADDREREHLAFAPRVGLHVGALETFDHVVAEQESVGESFEGECVLRSGDHHAVGHCPQGQDQLIVGQVPAFAGGVQVHHPPLQVDALHRGLDKTRGPQKGPEREGAMAHVKGSGKDLKQQRRHEQEVVPAHQNDLDIRTAFEEPFQAAGREDSAKAAAEDHNAFLRCLRRSCRLFLTSRAGSLRPKLTGNDRVVPPFDG